MIDSDAVARRELPFSFCRTHGVLLGEEQGGEILLYRNSIDLDVLAEVRRFLGAPVALRQLEEDAFDAELTRLFQRDSSEAVQVAEDLGADIDLTRLAEEIPATSELMDAEDDAPVIRLINALLSQAVREKASDIHVETFEENLVVRFRVDGVLREVLRPRRMLASLLVSRLKVMAQLDIAERRVPQDGRISVKVAGHAVDIRVSTIPSMYGERVVLRLLDKQAGLLGLDQLRMNDIARGNFEQALASPHGIILVTGPTGSGKTTTLYSGLSRINDTSRNILTIEDPIEYQLRGVGQTQVNTRVDMTFARGLRAILRQDPDVVMVGEIRDVETAQIAVQASLTGHLVLSTLHTNTAVGAITRLHDMGVETFLLSSSLLAVMAQRLVRLICTDCRESYTASSAERDLLAVQSQTALTLYRGTGCNACNHTGYRGRAGIYEFIPIDEDMRTMVHEGASEQRLSKHAREAHGSIVDDGRQRVLDGETTAEEVLRVTTLE